MTMLDRMRRRRHLLKWSLVPLIVAFAWFFVPDERLAPPEQRPSPQFGRYLVGQPLVEVLEGLGVPVQGAQRMTEPHSGNRLIRERS